MWDQCYEDDNSLGYNEQYYDQLSKNDLTTTVIREKFVWFGVNSFRLFDQISVMDDMLGGCSKYRMSFILEYYTKESKLFTQDVLNGRLFCFNYEPENNKPCALTADYLRTY